MVTATASSFLVIMVGTAANRTGLLLWLGCMTLVLAARSLDIFYLRGKRAVSGPDGKRELGIFAAGLIAASLVWGLFPILFFPALTDAGRTAAAVVFAAMAGGSATVLGPCLPLAYGYCTVQLGVPGLVFLLLPGRENTFLGVLAFAMLGAMVLGSRVANRTITKALRLSRVNAALVSQAELQRQATEAVNEQLASAQVALNDANQTLELRIAQRTADLEREMAERSRYAEAWARLASTDALTGLCNRTTFADWLAGMLADAGRTGARLAVLFLDLDNFKQINDLRGHAMGDQVLQAAAGLLTEAASRGMQIARWGGDEFVLAIPACEGRRAAMQMAETLRVALTKPLDNSTDPIRIDATIGVAMFPSDGQTADALIRAADMAMYEAKREGKARVKLFSPELGRALQERHTLEQAMQGAACRGEFSLVFQPIVSGRTGVCHAAEALIRWHHPRLGKLAPASWIPIAEQTGHIVEIGRWVLLQACRAASLWPDPAPAVTVNISVAQVMSGTLLDDVTAALAQTGLPVRRLSLEITESMFVRDYARVAAVFGDLRERGHKILLDDFGTGFSSLASLRTLPLDVVKIDQSFVRQGLQDDYPIVKGILSIASALSLQVTAEGVETAGQRERLVQLGVPSLQGFGIARPMDDERFSEWLEEHGAAARRPAEGMVRTG